MTTRPQALWPAPVLCVVVYLLLIAAPTLDGFSLNPLPIFGASLLDLGPWVVGALLLRFALASFAARRPTLPGARQLATDGFGVLSACLAFGALAATYCIGKTLLPYHARELHDVALHAFDVRLHLGVDPVLFVQALTDGMPWLDWALDNWYGAYHLVLVASTAWFLTTADRDLRQRFVRGFVLLWLGGLAGYHLLPAVGPIYAFPDLAAELATRTPLALATQAELWRSYRDVVSVLGGAHLPVRLFFGIAAMPSLHVAVFAYFAALTVDRRHPLRVAYLVGGLLTFIGSLLTAWHYAVDGYVGALLGLAAWLAVRGKRPAQADGSAHGAEASATRSAQEAGTAGGGGSQVP